MARKPSGNNSHSYADYDPSFAQRMREEWREKNPYYRGMEARTIQENLWSKTPSFFWIGFIGLIAWIASLLLKLMIPAKWKVITWLIGAIGTVGKWAFFIGAGIIVLLFLVGLAFKIGDWLKNARW